MEEKSSFVRKLEGGKVQNFSLREFINRVFSENGKVGGHLGRSVLASWCGGDEDLVEWNQRKGHQMYEMAQFYEREAAKASNKLHNIIDSSYPMIYR